MNQRNSLYLIAISFVASLGGFLFGYDTAIISGCNSFLQEHFQLSPGMLGWIASSALLGTIAGTIIAGSITDRFGRKAALITAATALSLSAIGSMLTPQFLTAPEEAVWISSSRDFSLNFLIIFRIIGGIGVGITSAVAPVFISEQTQPGNRGRFVSIYQLSITLGILLAFFIDWIVLSQAGDEAGVISAQSKGFLNWIFVQELWRGMFGTEIPIALLFLVLLAFTPESPRWLVSRNRPGRAMEILTRTSGRLEAQKQLADIQASVKTEKGGLKELLQPFMRRPLSIGILLPIFSHLSGIAAIMYFAPNIINEALDNVEDSFLGAILVGIVNSAFTFVAIYYIERFGRRKLLITGVTIALFSLATTGLLFALDSSLILIPMLFYVASFAFSYGPVTWVIVGEIFPTRIRGLAASLGTLALHVTGFFITLTNPVLRETFGASGSFFLYAILTIPAIWFIWKFIPETKGKSLEEIEKEWRGKV